MSKRNPFGYSCPKCSGIEINISAWRPCTFRLGYKFTDTEDTDGATWEDDDSAFCNGCHWEGPVKDLISDGLDVEDDYDEEDEEEEEMDEHANEPQEWEYVH